jgi:hypothetical protein
MKLGHTNRGFARIDFVDQYGVECSLQKSSLATEDCIWFGCNDANPQVLVRGEGWKPVPMPEEYNANTRMHLNREQVAEILPHLIAFVETGYLEPTA